MHKTYFIFSNKLKIEYDIPYEYFTKSIYKNVFNLNSETKHRLYYTYERCIWSTNLAKPYMRCLNIGASKRKKYRCLSYFCATLIYKEL